MSCPKPRAPQPQDAKTACLVLLASLDATGARAVALAADEHARRLEAATAKKTWDASRVLWDKKKGIALAFKPFFAGYRDLHLSVWQKPETHEKRVYLNDHDRDKKPVLTYYATGNRYEPPNTLRLRDRQLQPHATMLRALCARVAEGYSSLSVPFVQALSWEGEAVSFAAEFPPPLGLRKARGGFECISCGRWGRERIRHVRGCATKNLQPKEKS